MEHPYIRLQDLEIQISVSFSLDTSISLLWIISTTKSAEMITKLYYRYWNFIPILWLNLQLDFELSMLDNYEEVWLSFYVWQVTKTYFDVHMCKYIWALQIDWDNGDCFFNW